MWEIEWKWFNRNRPLSGLPCGIIQNKFADYGTHSVDLFNLTTGSLPRHWLARILRMILFQICRDFWGKARVSFPRTCYYADKDSSEFTRDYLWRWESSESRCNAWAKRQESTPLGLYTAEGKKKCLRQKFRFVLAHSCEILLDRVACMYPPLVAVSTLSPVPHVFFSTVENIQTSGT